MHQLAGTGWSNALYLRHQVCVEEQQQFLVGLVDRFNLAFPLTVDFSGSAYWINGGEALTSAEKRQQLFSQEQTAMKRLATLPN